MRTALLGIDNAEKPPKHMDASGLMEPKKLLANLMPVIAVPKGRKVAVLGQKRTTFH